MPNQCFDEFVLNSNPPLGLKKRNVVVHQTYQTDVNLEHVIRGNSAVLKCSVPSFVADFVTVDTWLVDDNHVVHGDTFGKHHSFEYEGW